MTRFILHGRDWSTRQLLFERVLLTAITIVLAVSVMPAVSAQCVHSSDAKSAVRFNNETRFELTFFIDDDEKGVVVAAHQESKALGVEPGEHLLRARAVVSGEIFWIWTVNEIPPGQVCTWTITDP